MALTCYVGEAFNVFFGRSAQRPFKSKGEMLRSPDFANVVPYAQNRLRATSDVARHHRYLMARDQLLISTLKVMADNKLDAIVHKSIEHQPTLIQDGMNPPFVNTKGAPHLNTSWCSFPPSRTPPGLPPTTSLRGSLSWEGPTTPLPGEP